MSDSTSEFSESGNPIYRHKPRERPFEMALGDAGHIKLIVQHISKYLGEPKTVFHELISDLVHIDIHIVPPSPSRNYYTLITSGMSARAMVVPEGYEQFSYAELLVSLPPHWPLKEADFKDECNYWPLRLLKVLARMPHAYNTWLGRAHTIPNGDPSERFAANTELCGAMISPAVLVPKEFHALTVSPEMQIHFYAVVPLYKEEMDLKLKQGADALSEQFDRCKISELLDVKRRNVTKRVFGLF